MRRALLVVGLMLMILSAARRAPAGGDVDVSGYGGTGTSHWACGSTADVKYGGVGAQVHAHPDPRGHEEVGSPSDVRAPKEGFVVHAAGAVERRGYTFVKCNQDPCAPTVPPDSFLGAMQIRIGYDFHYVGLEGGVSGFSNFSSSDSTSAKVFLVPDLRVRLGKQVGARGEIGLGGFGPATLLRYPLWAGFGLRNEDGIDFSLKVAAILVDDDGALWIEPSIHIPITQSLYVLGAAAVSHSNKTNEIHPMGQLGFGASL